MQAVEKYREAIQRARQLSDPAEEAKALQGLGRTLESLSLNDRGITALQQAAGWLIDQRRRDYRQIP